MTTQHPPRSIGRQLALGFGIVSVLAVIMCGLFVFVLDDVSELVAGMRHDETSIRQGMELATEVRDLAVRAAYVSAQPSKEQLEKFSQSREQVRLRIQEIAPRIPEKERWRLQVLGERTQRMHDLLAARVQAPAGEAVAGAAPQELIDLADVAAAHADALAQAATSQMAHAHDLAIDSTRLGLVGGALCVALVLALSIGFTWRLRAAVLKPLVTLTEAAQRFGRGDFAHRVGSVGQGELAAVGQAFDAMADELTHRERRLLQSERMAAIGQLAAGVAHELNNPIGIIRGYLKTMTPDSDPQTLKEELSILDEEAQACQNIAADLLSYARTDQLNLAEVRMKSFLGESARRFSESPAGDSRKVELEAQEALLMGDEARLRQVMLNLMSNAAQVSAAEQSIEVRGVLDGLHYVVEVEDHGPGVPPEERLRVFEPFYTQRRGGTGLGLSVCSGIVTAHQGSIEVVDGQAGGALFRLRLPLQGGSS